MRCCKACGATIVQKRFSNGVLESPSMTRKRRYCNRACMAAAMLKDRCRSQSHSRMKASRSMKAACETCGTAAARLHVHHRDEDWANNSPSNLMTLCVSCHRRAHSPNYTATGEHRTACKHCAAPSVKQGLCATHLTRLRRYGNPLAKKRKVGSAWVLMLHDGNSWSPLPLQLVQDRV